jgi:hypothetical protein
MGITRQVVPRLSRAWEAEPAHRGARNRYLTVRCPGPCAATKSPRVPVGTLIGRTLACLAVSLCAAELWLRRSGSTRRTASADSSLAMIARGYGDRCIDGALELRLRLVARTVDCKSAG